MSEETDKPNRRMSCWNCARYSRTDRRCREGKANPKRKSDSIKVAELLGVRTLCHYNPYREHLVLRMFFPCTPQAIESTEESRRRTRRGSRFRSTRTPQPLVSPAAAQPEEGG